jgi:hypothetical protein
MRSCVCLLVILKASERATALLENATPRFMRVRVAHWSLETPSFSVKTPWCANLDFCMAQWQLMAHQETVADTIRKDSKEPIPEDRHCVRQRQEGAATHRSRLPGFDPTASKIFCSSTPTALALCSIIGSVPDVRAGLFEPLTNSSRTEVESGSNDTH